MTLALADTASMPMWTKDEDAPAAFYTWGSYTTLGPFKPQWSASSRLIPWEQRTEHLARHTPKARWGQLRKWASTVAREVGETIVGAFLPVRSYA